MAVNRINPAKFKAFLTIMQETVDIAPVLEAALLAALEKAGFGEMQMTPSTTGRMTMIPASSSTVVITKPTPHGGRRTGYQVFYSAENARLKREGVTTGRAEAIVSAWKTLSPAARQEWQNQAQPATTTQSQPVVLSGYQFYFKAEMARMKAQKIHLNGADMMAEIGHRWKHELTEDVKKAWAARARGEQVEIPVALPVASVALPVASVAPVPVPAPVPAQEQVQEENPEEAPEEDPTDLPQ